jgi:hypothetical protein
MAKTVDNVINQKVGDISLLDGFLIGSGTIGSEVAVQRLTPFGNGNLYSGGTKILASIVLDMTSKNRYVKIGASSFLIDGMQDVATFIKGYFENSSNENNSQSEGETL